MKTIISEIEGLIRMFGLLDLRGNYDHRLGRSHIVSLIFFVREILTILGDRHLLENLIKKRGII